jgi:hypothetical protein
MATDAQRAGMHYVMDLLLAHRNRCHYAQIRPGQCTKLATVYELKQALAAPGGLKLDCSDAAILICRLAGLKDPTGQDYDIDDTDYTGTLLSSPHLAHYTEPGAAKIGAMVVFGPGTGIHVAMVYERGPDPLLWTHGEEGDPSLHRLSWMRPGFPSPLTFLSIAAL